MRAGSNHFIALEHARIGEIGAVVDAELNVRREGVTQCPLEVVDERIGKLPGAQAVGVIAGWSTEGRRQGVVEEPGVQVNGGIDGRIAQQQMLGRQGRDGLGHHAQRVLLHDRPDHIDVHVGGNFGGQAEVVAESVGEGRCQLRGPALGRVVLRCAVDRRVEAFDRWNDAGRSFIVGANGLAGW